MKTCTTKYWGPLEYAGDTVIRFPNGIYGFEAHGEFLLIQQGGLEPLVFLQSLQESGLCLPALPIRSVCPGYELKMQPEDIAALGLPPTGMPVIGDGVICLTIVRVHETGESTANLLAPLVISLENGRGLQAIAADGTYSHQHPIEVPARCSL